MKKYSLLVYIILVISLIAGCGKIEDSTKKEYDVVEKREIKIETITVKTAEINDDNAFWIQWPIMAVTDYHNNFHNKLENPVEANDLSKEEIVYFINYVEALEVQDYMNKHINFITKGDYEGHQYLGSVQVVYYDEDGNKKIINRYLFDEYPEGYGEFLSHFENICGEEYFDLNYNIQEVNADYYRQMARIGDDVKDETIEEFLDIAKPDMFHLLEAHNYYSARDGIDYINTYRHLPKELISKESTESELKEYAVLIAQKFDKLESQVYENKDAGCSFSSAYGMIEIYPSNAYNNPEYIKEFVWDGVDTKFYHIEDNSGPEGMIYSHYFVYSDDGKFMIVIPNGKADVINEIIKIIFDE